LIDYYNSFHKVM